jgi:hypothetical protein
VPDWCADCNYQPLFALFAEIEYIILHKLQEVQ